MAATIAATAFAAMTMAGACAQDALTQIPQDVSPQMRKGALDDLFARLKAASSAEEAELVEQAIASLWLKSGSATTDLLMERVDKALAGKDETLAFDLLNAVVKLHPGYAQGWNKRASVLFSLKEYSRALADIRRALALEPRHFGALAGLGLIMQEMGDKQGALSAFRKALAIHPFLEDIKPAVKHLEIEVEGQKI